MALDQMKVFNDYIMPATIETLGQEINKFNQASNGAIRLTTDGFSGDFLQESFFKSLSSSQRRVNRYATNSATTSTDLSQLKRDSVKVAGGIGPVRYEPSQMTWLSQPTAHGIEVASRSFAALMLQDQLNTAIKALVAAISNQADATNEVTTTISYAAMNGAHAKFGDRSSALIATVLSGAAYHKLIEVNLTNEKRLFVSNNVLVVDILGKPVIVTDAPDLTEGSDKFKALSLVDSAAIVSDGGDVISNIETSNGKERIETTLQVDYSFGLALKGYSWDESNGGKSPDDTKLATGANWQKVSTSIKDTAGVITIAKQTA